MIPYKDDNPTRTFPYLTIALIALNVAAFLWELAAGPRSVIFSYGAVPAALMGGHVAQGISPVTTVFTSMFLHGGFLHLAGNMLYLWIFGNNIEDKLGPLRFIVFYLLGGVVAAYSHALTAAGSPVPMVGASGAVAGILGAYLLLFPRAHVHTLIFLGFFVQVVRLPALIVIGFWAIIQFVSGLADRAVMGQGGGVAWFAHIGGFLFGVLTIRLFLAGRGRRRSVRWS